ncbi:hypothetical protein BBJ28_00012717 [Nothophytophthora sp. Chile5]|nr:hypothetical protein BBJ28_00012717 [Nothophytophthora sp. Chile5]
MKRRRIIGRSAAIGFRRPTEAGKMLALAALARRTRLLHAPASARCVASVERALSSSAGVFSDRISALSSSQTRSFSSVDGGSGEDEHGDAASTEAAEALDTPLNGELSPLERLMQHSQDFQLDLEPEDGKDGPDGAAGSAAASDGNDGSPSPQDAHSDRDRHAGYKQRKPRHAGFGRRQSAMEAKMEHRLRHKDWEDVDYERELETLWSASEAKERKFHQALRREQDKDEVCRNCGERGHRARNCLVPAICSNCGNLGHKAHECRRESFESVDEFVAFDTKMQRKEKAAKELQAKAKRAIKRPSQPRLAEVPVDAVTKRNERLQQEFEREIDDYCDMLDRQTARRRENRESPQTDASPSAPEKP